MRSLLRRLHDWFLPPVWEPQAAGRDGPVERPWRYHWDHLPKRSAGADFTAQDYTLARQRSADVARATLGEQLWNQLARDGYLDVPSRLLPDISYRLRIGRRIEVRCGPSARSPWPYPYLCINPVYPLPEAEFLAHLYLYARDNEAGLIRAAAPQPWDQRLGRTF